MWNGCFFSYIQVINDWMNERELCSLQPALLVNSTCSVREAGESGQTLQERSTYRFGVTRMVSPPLLLFSL